MKKVLVKGSLILALAFLATGCGGEGACCIDGQKSLTQIKPKGDIVEKSISTDIPSLPKIEPKAITVPPTAVALVNGDVEITHVNACKYVVYDASGSYDSDGDSEALKYLWSDSDANILSKKESFKKRYNKRGFYETTLEVTDEQNLTSIDRVCVLVGIQESDISLKASAGKNQNSKLNQSVKLSGHGICKTADDIATYSWKENGVELSNKSDFEASFSQGIHNITFTITDLEGNSAKDYVVISVTK